MLSAYGPRVHPMPAQAMAMGAPSGQTAARRQAGRPQGGRAVSAFGLVVFGCSGVAGTKGLAGLDQPAFRWTHLNAGKLI